MKNSGCLVAIFIVVLIFFGLMQIDCEKNTYKVNDSQIDKIIINTYTDICTVKYYNQEVHFDMDRTRVVVDSARHEITIDTRTYKFK